MCARACVCVCVTVCVRVCVCVCADKTPVNKCLLGVSLSSSLALMFPLQHYQHLCDYSYDLVIERGEVTTCLVAFSFSSFFVHCGHY